jgi:hypothetical protein
MATNTAPFERFPKDQPISPVSHQDPIVRARMQAIMDWFIRNEKGNRGTPMEQKRLPPEEEKFEDPSMRPLPHQRLKTEAEWRRLREAAPRNPDQVDLRMGLY